MLGTDSGPFDLRLRLLGTSVRIRPLFWVFGALFGYFYVQWREQVVGDDLGWRFVALWVFWLFISELVHDFGHILMAWRAGTRGQMDLGGMPTWIPPAKRLRQRVVIILAGPGAGFLFYAFALLVRNNIVPLFGVGFFAQHPLIARGIIESLEMLAFMNLFWNLLNLVPIYPLDGGELAFELFAALSRKNGYRLAWGLSALLATGGAAYSLYAALRPGVPYLKGLSPGIMAFFVGMMAIQNIVLLVRAERERRQEAQQREHDDIWRGMGETSDVSRM